MSFENKQGLRAIGQLAVMPWLLEFLNVELIPVDNPVCLNAILEQWYHRKLSDRPQTFYNFQRTAGKYSDNVESTAACQKPPFWVLRKHLFNEYTLDPYKLLQGYLFYAVKMCVGAVGLPPQLPVMAIWKFHTRHLHLQPPPLSTSPSSTPQKQAASGAGYPPTSRQTGTSTPTLPLPLTWCAATHPPQQAAESIPSTPRNIPTIYGRPIPHPDTSQARVELKHRWREGEEITAAAITMADPRQRRRQQSDSSISGSSDDGVYGGSGDGGSSGRGGRGIELDVGDDEHGRRRVMGGVFRGVAEPT
ncbi:hypothetical protein BD410DRAFT_803444 [Rickenella mellea]|uniref:Uncharacterized protein n=1 Tax=Rickenella mellea TaxID=50990 RepID=A0A4Y7Q4P9_9AGAM|nr:hypothetical protein BD410DRAFT_803444 [Rickenella mellea]